MYVYNPFFLLTWRSCFFCSWWEYPSTLVPGLLSTALPLLLHPPQGNPTDQVTYLHRRHQQHQPSRLTHYPHSHLPSFMPGTPTHTYPHLRSPTLSLIHTYSHSRLLLFTLGTLIYISPHSHLPSLTLLLTHASPQSHLPSLTHSHLPSLTPSLHASLQLLPPSQYSHFP
jgi:hypothetical protein